MITGFTLGIVLKFTNPFPESYTFGNKTFFQELWSIRKNERHLAIIHFTELLRRKLNVTY